MTKTKTEKQYKVACERIEELLQLVGNDTSTDDKNFVELDLLSDLVVDYEEANYPVKEPELSSIIKPRMYEMGIVLSV
jgi:HTH-type transcriptional regulator/antitoxin HigA